MLLNYLSKLNTLPCLSPPTSSTMVLSLLVLLLTGLSLEDSLTARSTNATGDNVISYHHHITQYRTPGSRRVWSVDLC